MKTKLNQSFGLGMIVIIFLFSGCSKQENADDGSGCLFSKSDFTITYSDVILEDMLFEPIFEVKNLKNISYDRSNSENCRYVVYAKIKATDGGEYIGTGGLPDMSPNGSGVCAVYINHPKGKVMDPKTLSYEIRLD